MIDRFRKISNKKERKDISSDIKDGEKFVKKVRGFDILVLYKQVETTNARKHFRHAIKLPRTGFHYSNHGTYIA